jgi:ABC-type multidrug transport system fused ATPase/permease subunit
MAWCCFILFSTRAYAITLAILFLIDFAISVTVFAIARSDAAERHQGGVYGSTSDDTLICCILRLLASPLLATLAMRVHNQTAATSPLRRLQADASSSSNGSSMLEVGGGVSLTTMSVPLTGGEGENASSEVSSNVPAEYAGLSPEKAIFEMKKEHTSLMKKARLRRRYVLGFFFAMSTGMSMYNGLKCVSFHYDPDIIWFQAILLGMILVCINLEFFMIRDFLNKLTEEKGELIPHMHLHELFFETGLKCHGCDVCHERMKGPHYIAYRCRTCDFDLCPRCYKQKDKPTAKGYGQRALRRDGEQITTWSYFTRIVGLSLDFWRTGLVALCSLVCCQLCLIVAPKIQGSIFDGIINELKNKGGGGRHEFERAMVTYLVINVLTGAFGGIRALSQELVTRSLAVSVRTKLFTSIIRMDIAFFDSMHTGQLTSRLTNDASQMAQPLNTLLNDLVSNIILLVGGMVMAFVTSWKLSCLALTVVPPITFTYREYASWGRKVNRAIYAAYGDGNAIATETISNIRTVRGFSTEQDETDRYDFSMKTALSHAVKNAYVAGSVSAFTTYMNLGTAVLILWYGGILVCDSGGTTMTIGSLITFQLYWNMMNSAFISLGNVFNDLIRSASAAERVLSLIDARPDVDPDAGEPIDKDAVKGHLKLQLLQFRYRTRPDNIVLKGVSLEMPPCTTTALVGKSGGGKSTLVHLLMRFYEPTDGSIYLDGRNMIELSSKSVRKVCGFVAQDTQLFAKSIEENLAYGLGRTHSNDELVAACKAANAHDFIMEMEEQYETRVGEKGILLSGGQRQRLAIARCFLRQPRLLFLDEATSSLDAENEFQVQQSLDDLIAHTRCTVVLIAHRLSTVINSNQIAVVHKGQVVELGTHEHLCSQEGIYAQLVKRQMSRDASAAVADRQSKGKQQKTVQGEIDSLIEEMEESGALNKESGALNIAG